MTASAKEHLRSTFSAGRARAGRDMRDSAGESLSRPLPGPAGGVQGFSLVELVVAMAVGLLLLGALYGVFTIQNRTFGNQEEIVAMQQSVRAGIDMIAREIAMAGYDPAFVNSDADSANDFGRVTVSSAYLQVRADLDGNGVIDPTGQEVIIYAFDAANRRITRKIGEWWLLPWPQPFLENVEAFTFAYLDGSGNVTANAASVRQIRLTITGRTARADPAYSLNGGHRTYTLTAVVAPRNLAF